VRLGAHRDWLAAEVLAEELEIAPDAALTDADLRESMDVEGAALTLEIGRAAPRPVG
jgi:hypothetical protein